MIELVQIPKDNTDTVWKQCEGMIADAMASSNNYANASHFKKWISEGNMQLWFLWDKEEDIDQRLWYSCYRNYTKTITAMLKY